MKVSIPRITIEELDRLPEDGNRYELIDGELYVSPSPNTRHQKASIRLLQFLLPFVDKHGLGRVFHAPMDVTLEPRTQTRVQPDLLFVAQSREHIIQEKGIYGAPDLVVEIVSQSSHWADLYDKRDLYRRCGVAEYWIVDPDERYVLVYRFAESTEARKLVASDTLNTPLLPGLEIPVASVFG